MLVHAHERDLYRGLEQDYFLDETVPRMVLTLVMFAYAVFFGWWSLREFAAFHAPGFDLGIFDQGLWLLSRFKSPFVTLMGLNLFGDHAPFILLALVPLYWVWPDPQALLVVQSLALAIGAIPVFLLARRVLQRSSTALLAVFAYLLMPALGWLNLENFHPDSFEVPLLLFAFYFMASSRWRGFFVTVFLTLMVKEDVILVVLPLGIYLVLRGERKMGALTCILAALWFALVFFVVQPHLSGSAAGSLDAWRIPFGGGVGLLRAAVKTPWDVLAYMATPEKAKYVVQLFGPLLFLPLRTARTLIVLPVLLFNLVSTFYYQSSLHYHYASLAIPILTVATILSLERMPSPNGRQLLTRGVLAATMIGAILWGPVSLEPAGFHDPGDPQSIAAAEAVALIPGDAVVASRDRFASYFTHREHVYVFPTPFAVNSWGDESLKGQRLPGADAVEYVLVLPGDQTSDTAAAVWDRLPQEGSVTIYDSEGVALRRRLPDKDGPEPLVRQPTRRDRVESHWLP